MSIKFREAHSHSPEIEFMGVWDTVGALGIPGLDGSFRILKGLDWQFHDVTLISKTRNAFHALAIHEHRAEFAPTLWELPADAPKDQRLERGSPAYTATWAAAIRPLGSPTSRWNGWWKRPSNSAGSKFDHKTLALHPDPTANGHDSFGAFYKVLDWLERKKGGLVREFRAGGRRRTRRFIRASSSGSANCRMKSGRRRSTRLSRRDRAELRRCGDKQALLERIGP